MYVYDYVYIQYVCTIQLCIVCIRQTVLKLCVGVLRTVLNSFLLCLMTTVISRMNSLSVVCVFFVFTDDWVSFIVPPKKKTNWRRSKVASYRRGSETAGRHDGEGCLCCCCCCSGVLGPQVVLEVQVAVLDLRAEWRLLLALGSSGAWWRLRTGDVIGSLMAPAGSHATWRSCNSTTHFFTADVEIFSSFSRHGSRFSGSPPLHFLLHSPLPPSRPPGTHTNRCEFLGTGNCAAIANS